MADWLIFIIFGIPLVGIAWQYAMKKPSEKKQLEEIQARLREKRKNKQPKQAGENNNPDASSE
ncbi:MAG: hypothetical protein K6L73_09035 [Cellvibrionaceae bacterium]